MTEQVKPQTESKKIFTRGITPFETANISLGAAFLLSFALSPGLKILRFFAPQASLRLLQPYQMLALSAFISYWIPALIIYLVLRLTKFDRKLSTSTFANLIITIAHILLIFYVSARVFASTVPGGGASFVVMSFSALIILPAGILLLIGFVLLVIRNVKNLKNKAALMPKRKISAIESTIILVVICAPLMFFLSLPVDKMYEKYKISGKFRELCKSAEVKVLEKVDGAKSIALLPDNFATIRQSRSFILENKKPSMNGVSIGSESKRLLNLGLLDFIETPAIKSTDPSNPAEFVRISTVGERITLSYYDQGKRIETQYEFEPISAITAEYEIRPQILERADFLESGWGSEPGWGGSRVEITRRADNKLIAFAQYYWSKDDFQACPLEAINGLFIYDFVAGALGVKGSRK